MEGKREEEGKEGWRWWTTLREENIKKTKESARNRNNWRQQWHVGLQRTMKWWLTLTSHCVVRQYNFANTYRLIVLHKYRYPHFIVIRLNMRWIYLQYHSYPQYYPPIHKNNTPLHTHFLDFYKQSVIFHCFILNPYINLFLSLGEILTCSQVQLHHHQTD